MSFCTKCGNHLPDEAEFCTACGAKMSPAAAGAAPPFAPPTGSGSGFRRTGLGFIFPAALFLLVFIMGVLSPLFLSLPNLRNIGIQTVFLATIALAVVLPARAKGPDLSIGAVIGLSVIVIGNVMQSGGSWLLGLLLALCVAAIIGAVNGVINGLIRIRSSILTILISVVVTGVVSYIVRRVAVSLTSGIIQPDLPNIPIGVAGVLVLLVVFIIVFSLNIGTHLGTPVFKNNRSVGLCIVSYICSSAIAALAGFFILIRLHVALPTVGMGNEPLIFFVFGCLLASRALDNRIAPAIYVLPLGLIWAMISNLLNLAGINSYMQLTLQYILATIALAVAFVSRYEKRAVPALPTVYK